MGRVWKRIIAIAERHSTRGSVLSETQAREIALAITQDEGVGYPGDDVLDYLAYALPGGQ